MIGEIRNWGKITCATSPEGSQMAPLPGDQNKYKSLYQSLLFFDEAGDFFLFFLFSFSASSIFSH